MKMSIVLALCTVVATFSTFATAEEADPLAGYTAIGESQPCIETFLVRDTKVLDDSTVLFRMRNGELYVNQLSSACPQLAVYNSFTYETHGIARLCNNDRITVFHSGRPQEFSAGATCGINEFQEVAENEE